jgi:hypothetical protein
VLKRRGKKGLFDLGNAEIILPAAPMPRRRCAMPLPVDPERRPLQRPQGAGRAAGHGPHPEELSKKFRYNQRRELRLLEEAGGVVRPVSEFSSEELAAIYCDLFQRRWGFRPPAPSAWPK